MVIKLEKHKANTNLFEPINHRNQFQTDRFNYRRFQSLLKLFFV